MNDKTFYELLEAVDGVSQLSEDGQHLIGGEEYQKRLDAACQRVAGIDYAVYSVEFYNRMRWMEK